MLDFVQSTGLLYSVAGFVVGFLIGITGVGGGSLMTPLLILLFGIHPATAVGTDLLFAAITKAGGTVVHGFYQSIDWHVVGRLAGGSLPTAVLTLFALSQLEISGEASRALITKVLSVALFVTAALLIFHKQLLALRAAHVGEMDHRAGAVTIVFGAILGVLVSISSVGAGAIGVTALVLLYPHLPMRRIVGSDIAHAVPLTLIGGIGYWILGSIDWFLLAALLAGSLPGIALGGRVLVRVPEASLRIVLLSMLIIVASKLAFW